MALEENSSNYGQNIISSSSEIIPATLIGDAGPNDPTTTIEATKLRLFQGREKKDWLIVKDIKEDDPNSKLFAVRDLEIISLSGKGNCSSEDLEIISFSTKEECDYLSVGEIRKWAEENGACLGKRHADGILAEAKIPKEWHCRNLRFFFFGTIFQNPAETYLAVLYIFPMKKDEWTTMFRPLSDIPWRLPVFALRPRTNLS